MSSKKSQRNIKLYTSQAKNCNKVDDITVGFEDKETYILDQLVEDGTEQLQVISVFGMAGLESKPDKERILEMEEESLVDHIYKAIKGRRYIIAMDDIWHSNVRDDFWRCFPDDRNGSRILLTTRNKYVAPPNSITYTLPSLSNDQYWELLENKSFNNEFCPRELQGIGKKIAANCCGLPLAVVVIAGILSTMDKEKSI